MEAKNLQLRGVICSLFRSESEFAECIGWSRQRLYNITSGRKSPNVKDVIKIAKGLKKPATDVFEYFI